MSDSKFLDLDGLNYYHTEAVKKLDPYVVIVGTQVGDDQSNLISDKSTLEDIEAVLDVTLKENDTVLLKELSSLTEGILYQVERINSILTLVAVGGSSKYKSVVADTDVTAKVGNLPAGMTKELLFEALPNQTISELMDYIIFPDNDPTISYPRASLSFSGTQPGTYLVGTKTYPTVTVSTVNGRVKPWKQVQWDENNSYTVIGDKNLTEVNYNGLITRGKVILRSNGSLVTLIPNSGKISAGYHIYSGTASAARGDALPVKTKSGNPYLTPYNASVLPIADETINMVFPYVIGVSDTNTKEGLISLINLVTEVGGDVTLSKPSKTKKESNAQQAKYLYVGLPSGNITFKDAAGNQLTAVTKYTDCSVTINETSTSSYVIYVTNNLVDTNNVQYLLS